jgi:hypothetical protein
MFFTIQADRVFCEVRTKFLNIIEKIFVIGITDATWHLYRQLELLYVAIPVVPSSSYGLEFHVMRVLVSAPLY